MAAVMVPDLRVHVAGLSLQNPIIAASGTCGYGEELHPFVDLNRLGAVVVKGLSLHPTQGNPAPRLVELSSGMLNSVGLANPGLEKSRAEKLPWIAANVRKARVLVSLAGHTVKDYFTLVEGLDGADGFLGFEVNLSCPNDAKRGGPPFALDPAAVAEIVAGCRRRTQRPLLAKLAPNDPDLPNTVRTATDAGADGLTLEGLGCVEPSKTASEDDDVWPAVRVHRCPFHPLSVASLKARNLRRPGEHAAGSPGPSVHLAKS